MGRRNHLKQTHPIPISSSESVGLLAPINNETVPSTVHRAMCGRAMFCRRELPLIRIHGRQ